MMAAREVATEVEPGLTAQSARWLEDLADAGSSVRQPLTWRVAISGDRPDRLLPLWIEPEIDYQAGVITTALDPAGRLPSAGMRAHETSHWALAPIGGQTSRCIGLEGICDGVAAILTRQPVISTPSVSRLTRDLRRPMKSSERLAHRPWQLRYASSADIGRPNDTPDVHCSLLSFVQYADPPSLGKDRRQKIRTEGRHAPITGQQVPVEMVVRLGERAHVDAFRLEGAPHGGKGRLQHRSQRRQLVRLQVGQLMDVPLGLEDEIAANERIHGVVEHPVLVLVNHAAGRNLATSHDVAGETLRWCIANHAGSSTLAGPDGRTSPPAEADPATTLRRASSQSVQTSAGVQRKSNGSFSNRGTTASTTSFARINRAVAWPTVPSRWRRRSRSQSSTSAKLRQQ